jgi:nucleoside-diphosphate-sugar epimerase
MRVFVAGGTGAIGVPLVCALVDAGHHVTVLTRSPEKKHMLESLGATPAVGDALDAPGLRAAVQSACPTHVIHQLTALPKHGVRRGRDLAPTNRLRIAGTRNLLDAAIAAGATRLICGSFALLQGIGPKAPATLRRAAQAVEAMESQVLEATREGSIEGIVLRYGLFYGPENPATEKMIEMVRRRLLPVIRRDNGLLPCIHIADAVAATVVALERGSPGGVYDIADDQPVSMSDIVRAIAHYTGAPAPWCLPRWLPRLLAPFAAQMTSLRLPLSNAKARVELGWSPLFPTWRDGLAGLTEVGAEPLKQ